jgi:taurine dioxygenase
MMDASSDRSLSYRSPSGLQITWLQPAIGGEISGIDLSQEIPPATAKDIYNALLAHGVIFFRNQQLDYKAHLALARVFGAPLPDGENSEKPEVLEVRARGGAKDESASKWHSDGCYQEIPPAASVLRSIVVPHIGGDTCFSSAVAVYEELSDEMKRLLAPLRYTSSGAYLFSKTSHRFFSEEERLMRIRRYPEVNHPVVRVHPDTGARAIYVNEAQTDEIVGIDSCVGRAIKEFLYDRIARPQYQVRWQWEPNAIAVWDNRAVQHYGVPNPVTDRYMERITVAGSRPLSIAEWNALDRRSAADASPAVALG